MAGINFVGWLVEQNSAITRSEELIRSFRSPEPKSDGMRVKAAIIESREVTEALAKT